MAADKTIKKLFFMIMYLNVLLFMLLAQDTTTCEHYDTREETSIQVLSGNQEYHIVRTRLICNICGAQVGENLELEEPHYWIEEYRRNGNATHSLIQKCYLCGYQTGANEAETCNPYLEHIGYRTFSVDEHEHQYRCSLCGQEVSLHEPHDMIEFNALGNEICGNCGQVITQAAVEPDDAIAQIDPYGQNEYNYNLSDYESGYQSDYSNDQGDYNDAQPGEYVPE